MGVAANRYLRDLDASWNAHAKGGVCSIAEALRLSAVERMVLSQVLSYLWFALPKDLHI